LEKKKEGFPLDEGGQKGGGKNSGKAFTVRPLEQKKKKRKWSPPEESGGGRRNKCRIPFVGSVVSRGGGAFHTTEEGKASQKVEQKGMERSSNRETMGGGKKNNFKGENQRQEWTKSLWGGNPGSQKSGIKAQNGRVVKETGGKAKKKTLSFGRDRKKKNDRKVQKAVRRKEKERPIMQTRWANMWGGKKGVQRRKNCLYCLGAF